MTNPNTDAETPCGLLSQTNFFGHLTPSQLDRVAALTTVQLGGLNSTLINAITRFQGDVDLGKL